MSVDYYWQRLPGDWLATKSPRELWDLFHRQDLGEDLVSFTVQGSCSLMHLVLTTAAPGTAASRLPVFGGTVLREGAEDPVFGFVGVQLFSLSPVHVREAADFLTQAPLERWVLDRRPQIRRHVVERHLAPSFGDGWELHLAEELTDNLIHLSKYFQAAAAARHAIISYQDA